MRHYLCRRVYFDVDHAVRTGRFDPLEPAFLDLVSRKIGIPRTGPVNVSEDRMGQLQQQLEPQLRPVLRDSEFARFDLGRAADTLRRVAAELARR